MKGDGLADRSRELKQECANKKALISGLAVKLSKMKEDICSLEMKVVRSPDRIKADTSNKEAELEAKRNEKRALTKEYMEYCKRADSTRKAVNDMVPSMESLRGTLQDIQTIRGKCADIEKLKEQLKVKQSKLLELTVIQHQKETNMTALKEQTKRSETQHKVRVKPVVADNERVKKQIDEKRNASGKSAEADKLMDNERKLQKDIEKVRHNRTNFRDKLEQVKARSQTSITNFSATFG
jgi:chromosome segregation ATPase